MLNLRMREQIRQAVVGQAELQSGRLPGAQPMAVAFVDIVGFTQLGEQVPPDQLGAVVREFERSAESAARAPVRLVKTIGDAAMLVAPEPAPLVDAVLGLGRSREDDARPLLRAGVAPARRFRAPGLVRPPVNLASRLTGFARRGSVVAAKEVRDAAGDDGYSWSFAGNRRFKGVKGEIEVFRVRPADGAPASRARRPPAPRCARRGRPPPADVGLVGLLPGEVVVLAAEVAVGGGLLVDRAVQVEVVAERAGAQVEVRETSSAISRRGRSSRCRRSRPSPRRGGRPRSRRPPAPRSARRARRRPRSWPRSAPRRRPSGRPWRGPCPRRRRRRGGPSRRRCRR